MPKYGSARTVRGYTAKDIKRDLPEVLKWDPEAGGRCNKCGHVKHVHSHSTIIGCRVLVIRKVPGDPDGLAHTVRLPCRCPGFEGDRTMPLW